MAVEDEQYNINLANQTIEGRKEALKKLKMIVESYKGNNGASDYSQMYSDDYNNTDNDNTVGSTTNAYTKVLSTKVGKAMADNSGQNGFSSALMLGIISFVFEAIFLAVAIFIYR